MLRIDRQNARCCTFLQLVANNLATDHERLLVCQRNNLASLYCPDCRQKSSKSNHCRQNHINTVHCYNIENRFGASINLYRQVGKSIAHFGIFVLVGNHNEIGFELASLSNKQRRIIIGNKHLGRELVGIVADYIKRLSSY